MLAQLIKLHQCISRYDTDIYRYAGRFIQQKKRRYQSFKTKRHEEHSTEISKAFYDRFIRHQMTWATSTPKEVSDTPGKYHRHPFIRFLLEKLDDTALILFEPSLQNGDTSVQCDVIILTPLKIWVVKILVSEPESVFQPHDRRQWKEIKSGGIEYFVNPVLSLQRSREIIRRIFQTREIKAPIKSCLLAPESYIEYMNQDDELVTIDKVSVKNWLEEMNMHRSALKHGQLRAAEVLLQHSDVSSQRRR